MPNRDYEAIFKADRNKIWSGVYFITDREEAEPLAARLRSRQAAGIQLIISDAVTGAPGDSPLKGQVIVAFKL